MSQPSSMYAERPSRSGPPRAKRAVTPPDLTASVEQLGSPSARADARPVPAAGPDTLLIDILTAPTRASETCAAAFARKEADFTNVCSRLSVVESHALHRRLSNPHSEDQLAMMFSRFVVDRRARILNYLAGARKRAALAGR
jgi:hypothetical protein